jgi:homopolymeric O-antigen transport system permease protein
LHCSCPTQIGKDELGNWRGNCANDPFEFIRGVTGIQKVIKWSDVLNCTADLLLKEMNSAHFKDENVQFVPIVIRRSAGWEALPFTDLWEYRELLYFLVWRDLKVRYKQTWVGILWVLIQPTFLTASFSIVFGHLASIPSDGIPYPLFAFCGILPWQFFAQALSNSANSLVSNEGLITKVYFPRLIIPLAAVCSALVDFAFGFAVLFIMTLTYGVFPTVSVFVAPLFILSAAIIALSLALWLSALNVQYRDVRYVIPFIIQFWFFLTPVIYPSSLLPERWRIIHGLNPLVAVLDGMRWALAGARAPSASSLMISAALASILLIGGLRYFRRVEKTFADVV